MNLNPDEIKLIGRWVVDGDEIHPDATCARIEQLTTHALKQIALSEEWGAWETLYQDPLDGRYWERTYPEGSLQGGGPPQLEWLPVENARRKYGDSAVP
jgi:hypothetical protein